MGKDWLDRLMAEDLDEEDDDGKANDAAMHIA